MGTQRQRRILLLLVGATVVITAFFLGQGTSRILAAALMPLDPTATQAGATHARSAPSAEGDADVPEDVMFGLFGGVPEPEVTPVESAGPELPFDPNAPLPDCEGSVRLVAAVVNPQAPQWSFASITDATGKAMLYRAGMQIDQREVVGIREQRVFLRQAGSVCNLRMFSGTVRVATVAHTPALGSEEMMPTPIPGADGPPDEGLSPEELAANITKVSETQYNVNRSLINKLLENQAALMRQARIIPHQEGGRVVGVKLYGIRRNSMLGHIGLQNGDMLRTINGYSMSSPDEALAAYARLQTESSLTVQIQRRGQTVNMGYNIQ